MNRHTRLFLLLPIASLAMLLAPQSLEALQTASAAPGLQAAQAPTLDRSQAYYHAALAGLFEEKSTSTGRPEFTSFAIEEYKKALEADPRSPQLQLALADLYYRLQRIRESETMVRQLLKNEADNLEGRKLLCRILLHRLGETPNSTALTPTQSELLNEAIGEYEKLVALQPKTVENRLILGQLYTVRRDTAKAAEQFQSARQIEPNSEEVLLNLVRIYGENGDLPRAAQAIEAVPAAERTFKMELALGAVYEQQKDLNKASEAYQRASLLEPGEPRILIALAQTQLANNQLEEARKSFEQAVALNPGDSDSLVRISEIYRRQGKFEEALAAAREARKADPASLEGGYSEGLLLDALGRYEEAVQVFQKVLEQTAHANGAYTKDEQNNRSIFYERLAAVYQEMGDTDKAVAAYQEMVAMGGDPALRGYQGQAEAYRAAHRFDKALESARKALSARPESRENKLLVASSLLDLGKGDEALALARTLLVHKPEDRPTLISIGQMCIRLHRWREAEEAFDKAAAYSAKKEEQPLLAFLRGELAERQKRYDEAERYFRQAIELDPKNPTTLNYLGYMLADRGVRLPEALALIRQALELDPMNGAYLDSLGWAYFRLGQNELAEENLRHALEREKSDPTIHDHLGDLYEKTGRIRLAAAQWELALAGYSKAAAGDVEPDEIARVERKLQAAHAQMARQDSELGRPKNE